MVPLGRIEDSQAGPAFLARRGHFEMVDRDLRHDLLGAAGQVLERNVPEILPEVTIDLRTAVEHLARHGAGDDLVGDALLRIAVAA